MSETCSVQLVRLYLVVCILCSLSSASDVSSNITILSLSGRRVDLDPHDNSTSATAWHFTFSHNSTTITLFDGGKLFDIFKAKFMINSQLPTKLSIGSVDLRHAGKYEFKKHDTEVLFAAELTVLEPECDTNGTGIVKEGDFLQIQCRVKYAGSLMPITTRFTWKKQDKEITPTEVITEVFAPNETFPVIVANSTVAVQLQSADNGITFMCDISFNTSNPSQVLTYSWNYKASVLYGPRNLTIKPRNLIDAVGTKLQCFVEANPAPNYEWIVSQKEQIVFRKSTSDIDWMELKSKLKNSQENVPYIKLNVTCTAFNNINGDRKEITEIVIFNVTTKTAGTGQSILDYLLRIEVISVVIIVLVAAVLVVFVVYFCKKGCCTYFNRKTPDIVSHVPGEVDARSKTKDGNTIQQEMVVYSEVNKMQIGKKERSAAVAHHHSTEENSTVYAEVIKERNGDTQRPPAATNHHTAEESSLVYAEVFKERNEPKLAKQPLVNSSDRKPKNYVGEDGTVYMDISSCGKPPPVQHPKVRPPACNTVDIYASIDHTQGAQPPPRPA